MHNGEKLTAEDFFEKAAQKGHGKAKQEISRKERMDRQNIPSFSNSKTSPCCFANSLTGNNLAVISSFPNGEWSLFAMIGSNPLSANAVIVGDIDEFIRKQHLGKIDFCRPRIIFLFMDEDENKNLNECLTLLDKLFNIVLGISDNQKWNLIDCIDIYVSAKYEIASMLIDASINDMGNDIYFKVHIMDITRDTAHQLLCDAPLFIPCLNRSRKENSANVVLFGCSETNYRFIKESIACAYLGELCPVTITLLGTDASRLEKRLRQECPGLYHEPHISCIRPIFISCDINEADFPNYIYGSEHDNNSNNPIASALTSGNYFIVDYSSDYDNIRFAMELRTWLLRSDGTFDRTPFIALKCTNSQNSYLASHLTLPGQVSGDTYYSKYDLFPFGIDKNMYSYQRLIDNPRLDQVALRIHKSYYGDNGRQAENDYYSFSYNADSSILSAIGLTYRLFAGDAFLKREQYLNFGAFDNLDLLSTYANNVKNVKDKERRYAIEQSRWNGFLLTRGWEPASLVQVQAYKNQSTGFSHKHMLAKLHPFIREWSELKDDDVIKIMGILKSKFDYDKSPRNTTKKSIEDTPQFLSKSLRRSKEYEREKKD